MLCSSWHSGFLQPAVTVASVQGQVETAVKIASWNKAKLGIVSVECWLVSATTDARLVNKMAKETENSINALRAP